jgi:hypothetical protein
MLISRTSLPIVARRPTTPTLGHTREIRACPLQFCFTPKPKRYGASAELSEKGHERKS